MLSKNEYKKISDEVNSLQEREKDLVIRNMPKFDRGIAEAAMEREAKVWTDLQEVFKKHNIYPSITTGLQTDNQPSEDALRPLLACAGIKVTLQYLVSPMDKTGKDGKLPDEAIEEIAEIRKKVEELQRKLERG